MSQTERDRPSVLRAARERTRAEITREILDAARRHLATDGASGLSLRAIARELGVSSSAVYGYVASRDELLTRLIVTAYHALGSAAETEEAAVDREDLAGRWAAACGAVRGWALANPNEYALIYGTPVPGYIAPAATIAPAARVSSVLVGILRDIAAGSPRPAKAEDDAPRRPRGVLRRVRRAVGGAARHHPGWHRPGSPQAHTPAGARLAQTAATAGPSTATPARSRKKRADEPNPSGKARPAGRAVITSAAVPVSLPARVGRSQIN